MAGLFCVLLFWGWDAEGEEYMYVYCLIWVFPSGNPGGFPDERQLCQRRCAQLNRRFPEITGEDNLSVFLLRESEVP